MTRIENVVLPDTPRDGAAVASLKASLTEHVEALGNIVSKKGVALLQDPNVFTIDQMYCWLPKEAAAGTLDLLTEWENMHCNFGTVTTAWGDPIGFNVRWDWPPHPLDGVTYPRYPAQGPITWQGSSGWPVAEHDTLTLESREGTTGIVCFIMTAVGTEEVCD